MVEPHTAFFTPGWMEWAAEFRRQATTLEKVIPESEKCWVGVGERQDAATVVLTIEREEATLVRPGWKIEHTDEGKYRYERFWDGSDPSVEEVIEEIRAALSAPPSASS